MPSSSQTPLVLKTDKVVRAVVREPVRTASEVFIAVGGGLWLVGAVELLLLWLPMDPGNIAWRFGTVSRTIEALPPAAVGAALLTFGLLRHPNARGAASMALSVVFGLLAAVFVGLGVLYLSAVPTAFAQASGTTVQPLRGAVVRTLFTVVVAVATSGAVAVVLWRGVGRREESGGSTPPKLRMPRRPIAPARAAERERSESRAEPGAERAGKAEWAEGNREGDEREESTGTQDGEEPGTPETLEAWTEPQLPDDGDESREGDGRNGRRVD